MDVAVTRIEKKFKYEDLFLLPDGNYEILDGERIDMTPTGFRHGKIEFKMAKLLEEKTGNKGHVAVGEVGIVITKNPFKLRAADVVYIDKETSRQEPEGILEVAPDLIIEILSKDDTVREMNEKVRDYLSIGVKRILLIDPFSESTTVYEHNKKDAGYYRFDEEVELIHGEMIRMREIL